MAVSAAPTDAPSRGFPGRGATHVLDLDGVQLLAGTGDASEGVTATLGLLAAEIVMVHVTRTRQAALLADACSGLAAPLAGRVLFMDRDWQDLDVEDTNALRSLLGRVFFRRNWLDQLDVIDNVLLSHLHHSRRDRADLLREAARLARQFGLPGLPGGTPADLEPADSQRIACVRAFMGSPRLLVLEHPTAGVYPQILPPLVNAVRAACDRGAAVLWITPSQSVWRDASIPATRRLRIARTRLVGGTIAP